MNQISIFRIPALVVLAFVSLGLIAHLSGTRPLAGSFDLINGNGPKRILEVVSHNRLMEHAIWAPFRNARQILYHGVAIDDVGYQRETRCLAQAVYFEARSEPIEGQMAIAQVVLNRVRSVEYPHSICGVVFQGQKHKNNCQFSFACDGISDRPQNSVAWKQATYVAEAALAHQQDDLTLDATHYHAAYVDPAWAATLKPTVRLGRHIFYRDI